jgi:hypothetical protein
MYDHRDVFEGVLYVGLVHVTLSSSGRIAIDQSLFGMCLFILWL